MIQAVASEATYIHRANSHRPEEVKLALSTPLKTATFLIRMTPEEREKLHAMAREQHISLGHAMREGARLYLDELRGRDQEHASVAT